MARRLSTRERSQLAVVRLFRPRARFGTTLKTSTINKLVRGSRIRLSTENIRKLNNAYTSQDYRFSQVITYFGQDGIEYNQYVPYTTNKSFFRQRLEEIKTSIENYFNVDDINDIPDDDFGTETIRVMSFRTGQERMFTIGDTRGLNRYIEDAIEFLIT